MLREFIVSRPGLLKIIVLQATREILPDRNSNLQKGMKSTGNSKYVGKYTVSLRSY